MTKDMITHFIHLVREGGLCIAKTGFQPRLIAVLLLSILASSAQADSIDDYVKEQMAKRHIHGLSLAIIQDGKIVKAAGYGVTDIESKSPVTTATLFQAGSISKSVSAMGALHLVEQRQLALDEDVNVKLTSWKLPDNEFTKQKKVTLREILSHAAGITVHGFPGYAIDARRPTLIQVLNGEKPANTAPIRVDMLPGSQWRYSGGGYTVMQQMILDVTGEPFPQFMQKTVLQPLGMTSSSFSQPPHDDKAKRAATGYLVDGKEVHGRWHVYPEMAAAGLWTNPTDLARFAIGLQQSLAGKSSAVLTQSMSREMVKIQKQNDGLGVFLQGVGKTLRFSHDGRDEGFDASLFAYAETGQGAVVMINANENSPFVADIIEKIAAEYHWPDYPMRPHYMPVPDKEPRVTKMLKAVWEKLADGKYDKKLFTPELDAIITTQLKQGLGKFLHDLGPLKAMELVERKDVTGSRIYRYRLTFEKGTMIASASFNSDNKISNLSIGVK